MTFGQKLKELRKSKKLTLKELATLSHVCSSQISNLERGKVDNPHIKSIKMISDALEADYDELYRLLEKERGKNGSK